MDVSGAFATAAMDRSSGKPGTLGLRCGMRGESLSTGDLVAFLVSEEDFDGIFTRIQAQGIPYGRTWDGPLRNRSTTTTADLA
jgi:hypothetical protein